MTGQRNNFAFGAFAFGALNSSPLTFGTLLSIDLALLGANLFSRFASINPFNCVFRIIFIWVFIHVLGSRAFAFGTMLHSTDLMFLKTVMISPFAYIFRTTRSIFRFKFIGMIFRFEIIKFFFVIPSIEINRLISLIALILVLIVPLIFILRLIYMNRSCWSR